MDSVGDIRQDDVSGACVAGSATYRLADDADGDATASDFRAGHVFSLLAIKSHEKKLWVR